MKKKILVTGGAGFIGSHLVDILNEDRKISKIVVIDNFSDGELRNLDLVKKSKKVKIIKSDLLNLKRNEKYFKDIDCIVHLAALSDLVPSIDKPVKFIENNFNGTLKILEAMNFNNIKKIIFAASSTCYGKNNSTPTKENQNIDLCHPYAFSKKISEDLIVHWAKIFKINFISLRFFNVFGTRSRTNNDYGAVFGVFMKQKLMNKPYTVVGNGNQKRDFLYVSDACNAIKKSIFTSKKNLIFNVGSGKPKSILYLTKLLKGKKIFIPKRPGEPAITHADIRKIKKELNWKPKVSFEEGVSLLIKDIEYWKNSILWNKNKIKKATKNWFKYLK
jgi:UDP-glucose 4-epimerase